MRIYLGSDHGGYVLKNLLQEHLKSNEAYEVVDLGVFNDDSVDYPDIAREVCEKVIENNGAKGVLICGTGLGMQMTASKIKNIRAALCTNEYMARMSREHNNANVLCMGERVVGSELAKAILDKFLETEFLEEERHVRRVEKIESVAKELNNKN